MDQTKRHVPKDVTQTRNGARTLDTCGCSSQYTLSHSSDTPTAPPLIEAYYKQTQPKARCPTLQPVKFSQQLRDDAVHDPARVASRPSSRCQGVQLVKEHHTRPRSPSTSEHLAHLWGGSS